MQVAFPLTQIEYRRRTPEQEVLYDVLRAHLATFLAQTESECGGLPEYVEKELSEYLRCGILGYGFVRMRCNDCGKSVAVAFSCKGRGFCPSCTGRRMADTSARLVDDVFATQAPVRQWVLSLPFQIRYRLSSDSRLHGEVLAVFLRVVQGWYRRKGREAGIIDTLGGTVTFAQRFGSALNLNPHFHSLALDGVFNTRSNVFHEAPPVTDADVKQIVETTARRVIKLLRKRGVLNENDYDDFSDAQPVLSALASASIKGLVATGDRSGRVVRRVLSDPAEGVKTAALCYASRGFSLHAATRIAAGDKAGLERLCNYVARPPLAAGSLKQLSDEAYSFKLKTPWDDGTTHLIFSPMELIEKLAALVPPPRVNLIRYHGVFAPHTKNRAAYVPKKPAPEELEKTRGKSANRLLWAALLARTFGLNMEVCAHCGGKMRFVAALTDPASIKAYLDGVGLPSAIPEIAPARPPPQMELDYIDIDCDEGA